MKIAPLIFLAFALPLPSSALTKQEATDFLFSTLTLPDRYDYSKEFYLDNIDASFQAREEMPWGQTVPDKEFLHFVLPIRVNNENIDESRMVFYEALKDRVKNLSMSEAILEVNHWCHEHVTYQPSDGRTSSPLSTLSQAIGRCGEESTFTVAALRAVGIPARQIYTPRWAHTDDNHAWVEAWADGEWHFLGACEPEPVLDLAWFNAPASRGMLMSTNVVGSYPGPEEILHIEPYVTSINVTSNYAPTATLPVRVLSEEGNPVAGAKVYFCIYNYAEYFPAVSKITDSLGHASLNAGYGDLIIWASDGSKFGFAKGNPKDYLNSQDQPLVVVLDRDDNYSGSIEFDIIPPAGKSNLPVVSPELRKINDNRLAYEDSIRKAYIETFISDNQIQQLAQETSTDYNVLSKLLPLSRGNHKMLSKLLRNSEADKREKILALLGSVTEKDLRDIPEEAILDHVLNTTDCENVAYLSLLPEEQKNKIFNDYILNPRVEREMISPWRAFLSEGFGEELMKEFGDSPELLVKWVAENIQICEEENPQRLRMSPVAVWTSKQADNRSRNIFFVASARTAGIPARIDPITHSVQYMDKDAQWIDIPLFSEVSADDEKASGEKGYLMITFEPKKYLVDPKYYSQFSISKINDGVPTLLEFDEDLTLSQIFSSPYPLETGQYILTSGQRLADGSVLARSELFSIIPGETVNLPLTIREDNSKLSVIGSLNAENIYHDIESDIDKSILSSTGRGFYVLGIISPNHEPSEHALNDISAVKEGLEKDGRKIMVLFEDSEKASRFNKSRFPNLPENVIIGIDNNGASIKEISESLNINDSNLPIFIFADSFNRIVWAVSGYNIGLGEQLLQVLSNLE